MCQPVKNHHLRLGRKQPGIDILFGAVPISVSDRW
jgi:hypothetical protein